MDNIISPEVVAMTVGQGGYWSRATIAEALGRAKTTWLISNIEKAVELGMIYKLPGTTRKQRAWVYTIEASQLCLNGEVGKFQHGS